MRFFWFLVRLFRGPRRRPSKRSKYYASQPRPRHPVRYADDAWDPPRPSSPAPLPPPQQQPNPPVLPTELRGTCWVIDGDTIVINGAHIRLAGIDAPELDHPYGKQSKWAMVQLCKGQIITAHIRPELSYDRLVAQCLLPDGRDLASELVRAGLALDWPKFSGGRYKHLEPPGARKKLWMVASRQRGAWRTQVDD